MADYILSGCSAADLTKEHFERIDVHYICFHFMMDGVLYPDDLGQTMPADEMYARMAAGASTSTSQVNISEYVDYFSAFCEQGRDIVHVTLSSGISGTYGSAANAALIVKERYPEREIYVVDSLGASSGYGLLLDTAAAMRDQGLSAKELAAWVEANRLRLNHWFFSTDLFEMFFRCSSNVFSASGFVTKPNSSETPSSPMNLTSPNCFVISSSRSALLPDTLTKKLLVESPIPVRCRSSSDQKVYMCLSICFAASTTSATTAHAVGSFPAPLP